MSLPTEAIVIDAPTFEHLSRIVKGHMEDELHRRSGPPAALRVYINSTIASDARQPENGTALIAWAQAQGTWDVSIRLDKADRFLHPPQCAYWLRWD